MIMRRRLVACVCMHVCVCMCLCACGVCVCAFIHRACVAMYVNR